MINALCFTLSTNLDMSTYLAFFNDEYVKSTY
jgi:hypothetical protein